MASQPPSLNVYRKISVIRRSSDTLNYEDPEGNVKSVSVEALGDAISRATPLSTAKPKLDIPVPRIFDVVSYEKDVPPDYIKPLGYVRYHKTSPDELEDLLEYVVDAEDENWWKENAKFGGAINKTEGTQQSSKAVLPLDLFERMMDLMEKDTAFDAIITVGQAESLFLKKIPQIYQLFPNKPRLGITTTKHVIQDIYSYWMQKRSKLKRPLLRRFWPPTSSDDTNPHLVFRPREKEKYKLRKKRTNDMEGYRKMKALRNDFDNLRAILDLVKRREELERQYVRLQVELFQQRLFDIVDTTGKLREPKYVTEEDLKRTQEIPVHFDPQHGGRKHKRPRHTRLSEKASRDTGEPGPSVNIAGKDHGTPGPLFLHPLETRESYTTDWHGKNPFVPTYMDSYEEPTARFRHRPRVGRGGRICIDRLPLPLHPKIAPQTYFSAGRPLPVSSTSKERLLDFLPQPLDFEVLSRRIEELGTAALKDDYEARQLEPDNNDGDELVVKLGDWLETDDQLWGDERFATNL